MTGLYSALSRAFDFAFRPLESLAPLGSLAIFSFVAGILLLVLFRYTSNQRAIRRVKDRIQAQLLAGGLFQDNLVIVLRSHARALLATLTYMRYSLVPLAVMLVPVAWLLIQLDLRYGWLPLQPGEPFLLRARVEQAADLDSVSLRLPAGLAVTAPALRIPEEKEINWRLQAARPGDYAIEVALGERVFAKQISVAGRLPKLSTARVRAGLLDSFLNPGEPPLPADSPLTAVEVNYRRRALALAGFHFDWLVIFILLSMVSGFAVKGWLKTEI